MASGSQSSWASYLTRGVGPMKKICIGGNWKCNGTRAKVAELVTMLNSYGPLPLNCEVIIAAPAIHLPYLRDNLEFGVQPSAQNVAKDGYGAYTGELCAEMLLDSGIQWTITGHSERRVGFGSEGESSALVAEKTKVALDKGMCVIACVGEQLADREAGRTLDVVLGEHMSALAAALAPEDWSRVVIAYEPVWAIGTGVTATPEQAEEVHAAIRKWMAENLSPAIASAMRIQYGGSVKASNAATLIAQPNIDGFLVGGASLKPDFLQIIEACKSASASC